MTIARHAESIGLERVSGRGLRGVKTGIHGGQRNKPPMRKGPVSFLRIRRISDHPQMLFRCCRGMALPYYIWRDVQMKWAAIITILCFIGLVIELCRKNVEIRRK